MAANAGLGSAATVSGDTCRLTCVFGFFGFLGGPGLFDSSPAAGPNRFAEGDGCKGPRTYHQPIKPTRSMHTTKRTIPSFIPSRPATHVRRIKHDFRSNELVLLVLVAVQRKSRHKSRLGAPPAPGATSRSGICVPVMIEAPVASSCYSKMMCVVVPASEISL